MVITSALTVKQVCGRFVIATIKDPKIVLLLSVLNGVAEFSLRLSVRVRDRCLYSMLFKKALATGELPHAQMENLRRNGILSTSNSMYETMSEMVAIWNGVLTVLFLDISRDGKSVPTLASALQTGAIQTATELITDFVSILALSLILNINILKKARNRRWYWSLPAMPTLLLFSLHTTHSLLPRVLCRSGELKAGTWVPCQNF